MRRQPAKKGKPKTIDEFLATLSPDKRAALERLRKTIQAAAPNAKECISYQMPAFCLDGSPFVWFGATANHCSFYPGGIVQDYLDELEAFETSKGTIRFQADHPIPATLIRKLVKARAAQTAARKERSGRTQRKRA